MNINMNKKQKGFSLIELLIVVAIILIIAAIAIPNLLRAKMAANEASAVGSLRTLTTAAIAYSSSYDVGFPATLADLGPVAIGTPASCTTADLIDNVLVTGVKSGYKFAWNPIGTANPVVNGCTGYPQFVVSAVPTALGSTGQRSFCATESGVIRFDPSGAVTATTEAGCQALSPLQ